MSQTPPAAPAFDPAAALTGLKRTLRDLRVLTERGNGFALKGQAVIELATAVQAIDARLARRPARSPEWDRFALASPIDIRRFVDEAAKRLARWTEDDR